MPNFSVSSFISFPSSIITVSIIQLASKRAGPIEIVLLNFNSTKLGSVDARGSSFVLTFIPVCRAFGGRKERNNRAVLDRGEKGLKTVDTSVMKRVIILTGWVRIAGEIILVIESSSNDWSLPGSVD